MHIYICLSVCHLPQLQSRVGDVLPLGLECLGVLARVVHSRLVVLGLVLLAPLGALL